MARSLKIRIDGSGSCIPLAETIPGGTLADNLPGAPSIANFAAINVPVFTWDAANSEAVVIDPDGEQYTLDDWCQDHQISAAGKQNILDNIVKEEGTCSVCRATFHPSICLHSSSSPFPLVIKNRKLILHVSRRWDTWKEARPDPSKPWAVYTGIDYGNLAGNNRVTVYLSRPTNSGSNASPPYVATYTEVPGLDSPFLPWPDTTQNTGFWPRQGASAADVIPYQTPIEDSPTALVLGPRSEVLKITYNLAGVTNESGAPEPIQAAANSSSQPESALISRLHRAPPFFFIGLIPPPKSDPGNPYHYEPDWMQWTGDTGPWRMGVYSQSINGATRRAFIKIGQQSGTIEAVKTALNSPTADPLVIGHASPHADGNLWQQSDTGSNAKIPFEDGSVKTALLPADAALQIPYNLHFAETCWADTCIVTVRVFTGSGNTPPTRVDAKPTLEVSLANTPVTSGATVATSGAAIEWRSGTSFLVVQLQNKLDHYYDSGLRAEVYALDQDKTFQIEIALQRGKAGIFPITSIDDSEEPSDFGVFSGYTSYSMDLDIDPETT